MDLNFKATNQDFSGLDSVWIDEGRTNISSSLGNSELDSQSNDSLRFSSALNLNPEARPFDFDVPPPIEKKVSPSSGANGFPAAQLPPQQSQQQQQQFPPSVFKPSQEYDSWYNGPARPPEIRVPVRNQYPPHNPQLQQQAAPGGPSRPPAEQSRFSSYNSMISSLGQYEQQPQPGPYDQPGPYGGGTRTPNGGMQGYSPHAMNMAPPMHESDYPVPYRPQLGGRGGKQSPFQGGGAGGQYNYAQTGRGGGYSGRSPSMAPRYGSGGSTPGGSAGMYGGQPGHAAASFGSQAHGEMGREMSGTIYEVQFKAAFRYFVLDPMNPVEAAVGEFVIVEGDRGEDLGIVTQTMSMMAFIELKCSMNNSSLDEHENSVKRILRVASTYERQQLPAKYYDEQQVIEYCNELISAKYQIPLIIVNAEYQFDRNKITLYYDASTRIDFRELVRDLYSTFKTRIWMKQVDDHKQFYPLQFAVMSLATGSQFNP